MISILQSGTEWYNQKGWQIRSNFLAQGNVDVELENYAHISVKSYVIL